MAKRKRSTDKVLEALTDKASPVVVVRTPLGVSKTVEVCHKLANHWPDKKIFVSNLHRVVVGRYGSMLCEALGPDRVSWRLFGEDYSSPETAQVVLKTTRPTIARIGRSHKLPDILVLDATIADIENDLLLGVVKAFLPRSPGSRVVLMAEGERATKLAQFFGAPVLTLPGGSKEVTTRVFRLLEGEHHVQAAARAAMVVVDEFLEGKLGGGSVLVLVPGREDVKALKERLCNAYEDRRVTVGTCHGKISPTEMENVWRLPAPGEIRLIVGTEVLRWLDIPGLVGIVDSLEMKIHMGGGMKKVLAPKTEADRALSRLAQAGGFYYPVSFGRDYENLAHREINPILYASLVRPLLFVAAAGLDVLDFPFIEQPPIERIKAAVLNLRRFGALDEKGKITPTGRLMERLPIEPRLAAAISLGRQLGVLPEVLIVSAALESQGIYTAPRSSAGASGDVNDFALIVRLYRDFAIERERVGHLATGEQSRLLENWCSARTVKLRGLEAIRVILSQVQRVMGEVPDLEVNRNFNADDLTRALLPGLFGSVGVRTQKRVYARSSGGSFKLPPTVADSPPIVLAEGIRRLPTSRASDVYIAGISAPVDVSWLAGLPGFEVTRVVPGTVEVCFDGRILGYVDEPGSIEEELPLDEARQLREQVEHLLADYGERLSDDLVRRLSRFVVSDTLLPETQEGLQRWIAAARALVEEARPGGEASESSLARLREMYGRS